MKIYLNGKFVTKEKAVISIFDHGFLYGDAVFETLRAYKGKLFKPELHIQRLYRSADEIKLKLPNTKNGFLRILEKTLRVNKLQEALVRLTITRGAGKIGLLPSLCKSPAVLVLPTPFIPYLKTYRKNGVSIITSRYRKSTRAGLPSNVKSGNYLLAVLAKEEAHSRKAFDAVYLDERSSITEGTTSNIFIVTKNSVLMTPPLASPILQGVTRKTILEIAKKNGMRAQEKLIPLSLALTAKEAFLANTSMEIMPVTRWDGKKIGNGKPGALTQKLHALFKCEVQMNISKPFH